LKKIYNFLILVISLFFAVGNTFAEPNKDKQPNKVLIGFYINGIHSLDLKTGTVGFDVYLWLKTKEKRDILDSVEIMNGSGIEKSSIIKEVINGEHYYSARLQLNSFQNFNFSKFPLDSQQIKLVVEDTVEDINSLVFEVDDKNSNISDSISLAGWNNYGDSRMGSNSSSYSSTELVIPIERDGLGYFFKLLGTVFLSAAVAFLCLFIKPNNLDPRFGLAVGGIFAVVASNFVLSSMLPETSQVTMGETLLIMTMGFILIVILESVVSLRYFEGGRKKLSEKIDARSGVFLPLLYLMSVFFVIFYFLSL